MPGPGRMNGLDGPLDDYENWPCMTETIQSRITESYLQAEAKRRAVYLVGVPAEKTFGRGGRHAGPLPREFSFTQSSGELRT